MKLLALIIPIALTLLGCVDQKPHSKPSCADLGCDSALCNSAGDCVCNGQACTSHVPVPDPDWFCRARSACADDERDQTSLVIVNAADESSAELDLIDSCEAQYCYGARVCSAACVIAKPFQCAWTSDDGSQGTFDVRAGDASSAVEVAIQRCGEEHTKCSAFCVAID